MNKMLNVIKYYSYYNKIDCTHIMHIRMSFWDRLKFVLFGENCIFCFTDEVELQKRKEGLECLKKWFRDNKMKVDEEHGNDDQ